MKRIYEEAFSGETGRGRREIGISREGKEAMQGRGTKDSSKGVIFT